MLLTMVFPVPVRAATIEDIEEETGAIVYADGDDNTTKETDRYAIISTTKKKAVGNTRIGWGDNDRVRAEASYVFRDDKYTVYDDTAQFKITKVQKKETTNSATEETTNPNGELVYIQLEKDNHIYPLQPSLLSQTAP